MLITLVLILLLIGAAVVGSIYSNFLVFYSNFNESENYHKAYYSSIAALERAELVIKQRSPGYIGNGGWILGETSGKGSTMADGGSDGIIKNNGFSYLSNNGSEKNTSTVFWDINSRTTRIPAKGKGDIETMLAYSNPTNPTDPENSNNFNMMDYNNAQIFLLYYDKSTGNPYEKTKCTDNSSLCTQSAPQKVKGKIRLPAFLKDQFGELDTSKSLIDKSSPSNDAIVDRQIRGKYLNNAKKYQFTIYATQKKKNSKTIDDSKDSAIRESHINNNGLKGLDFEFSKGSKRSPTTNGKSADLTIISPMEDEIKSNIDFNGHSNNYFETILTNNSLFTEKQIRFSLLNLLQTTDASIPKIYPFLEYYVEFYDNAGESTEVSDKYFTIETQGNYGDYKIDKTIRKPTSKESVLGNFTSIF